MKDEAQFKQLILQYTQLRNSAEEIRSLIEKESFDSAMGMLKSREEVFLSCKCMRKYLELSPVQEAQLNALLDEIRVLELSNIRLLESGMRNVRAELKKSQQHEKIQQAYEFDNMQKGSIVDFNE